MDIRKLHPDHLTVMSEDELHGRVKSMRGLISRERASFKRFEAAEVELCYLQRELEIRAQRRQAHAAWLERFRR